MMNLNPWNVIGWLTLGTLAVTVVAVLLFVLVLWQRHLLAQYLIRRDWRKTRKIEPPARPGICQRWGWNHGPQKGCFLELNANANGTYYFQYFPSRVIHGAKTAEDWNTERDSRKLTLLK